MRLERSWAVLAAVLIGLSGSGAAVAQPRAGTSTQPAAPPDLSAAAAPDARGAGFAAAPGVAASSGPRPRKVIVEPPASPPDRAARAQADESNLQPIAERDGIAVGASLIVWQQVSTIDDADRGGGVVLRLGRAATPNTVVYLEVLTGAFLNITQDLNGGGTTKKETYIEGSGGLMATAQTYVRSTVWLRAGGGLASYTQVVPDATKLDMPENRVAHVGLGAVGGIGVDLVRWRTTRLAFEAVQSLHRFRSGWLFDLGFGIGLTYY
jgi:hypothetical protein